MKSWKARDFCF